MNVVTTNRGGICAVCQSKFGPLDDQFTHTGGKNHDGFHDTCLETWLDINPTCPIDGQPIDPNSLISLKDRIEARREALTLAGLVVGAVVLVPALLHHRPELQVVVIALQAIARTRQAQAVAAIGMGGA